MFPWSRAWGGMANGVLVLPSVHRTSFGNREFRSTQMSVYCALKDSTSSLKDFVYKMTS